MGKSMLLVFSLACFALNAPCQSAGASTNSTSYSAGSKEDLSRLAGTMLNNVNQARAALQNGRYQAAAEHVKRAESVLERLEAHADGATLIPVYQEFVSVSILGPVRAEQNARKHVSNAPANRGATVHEVAGDYTRLVVSTTIAKNGLAAAKAALANGNWKTADAALADVQDGLQMESVEADMPLARARQNLILARADVREGHYDQAQTALTSTSNALSKYEAEGGAHVSAAKNLQQQIEAYDHNLAQNHAGAVAKINHWWNITSDWAPYENQQASSGRH